MNRSDFATLNACASSALLEERKRQYPGYFKIVDGLARRIRFHMDATDGKHRDYFVAWIVAKDGDGRCFSRAISFTGNELRTCDGFGTRFLIQERISAAIADFPEMATEYPVGGVLQKPTWEETEVS